MFRTAVFTTALMITSNVAANDDNKCFCPVGTTTGGKCRNSNGSNGKYKSLSTHPYFAEKGATGGIARCKAYCAEEPDRRCKGYAWRADIEFDPSRAQDASVQGKNCHLYDYVPDRVTTQSADGTKDFTDWSCFGMSGTSNADDYTLFLPGRNDGGKCSAPVYSGSTICKTPSSPSQFCAQRISVDSLVECKQWCDSRGNLCEGFDFGPVYGGLKCWERRYKPTGAGAPSSRNDYSDMRCHAKNCNCD